MRTLIALFLLDFAAVCAAGTINLPPGPYCATTQTAGVYNGVTAGACTTVPPIIPAGRQLVSTIKYPNAPGSGVRSNANVALWGTVFGHRNSTDAEAPWPGAAGTSPAIVSFTGSGYIALEFTPTQRAQVIVGVSSYYGWLLDGAWSTRVGDFSGNVTGSPNSACAATRGAGESFPKLSSDPSKPGCYIARGTRAVLNLRLHVPQAASPTVQFNLSTLVYGP